MRWLSITALALWLSVCCWPAFSAEPFSDRYDDAIRAASSRWLPGWDWRWWKAQLFQESRLDPHAVSPVGAKGLCQSMPGTWEEITHALRWGTVSPFVARYCIEGGAWYMARQRAFWTSPRPESDRRELAQASYNAGAGNILAAQRHCLAGGDSCRHWPAIAKALPAVTGVHAHETIQYVQRIRDWFVQMLAGVR